MYCQPSSSSIFCSMWTMSSRRTWSPSWMMWQVTWPGCNASVNTHAGLTVHEAATTLRMMVLTVGHTCCIARIAGTLWKAVTAASWRASSCQTNAMADDITSTIKRQSSRRVCALFLRCYACNLVEELHTATARVY